MVINGTEYVFHRGNRYNALTRMICNSLVLPDSSSSSSYSSSKQSSNHKKSTRISPKDDAIADLLLQKRCFPCMVFSGFLENGISSLDLCLKEKVPFKTNDSSFFFFF